MTVAAIDRLVHHATILEMNAESFRQRAANGTEALGDQACGVSAGRRSPWMFGDCRLDCLGR